MDRWGLQPNGHGSIGPIGAGPPGPYSSTPSTSPGMPKGLSGRLDGRVAGGRTATEPAGHRSQLRPQGRRTRSPQPAAAFRGVLPFGSGMKRGPTTVGGARVEQSLFGGLLVPRLERRSGPFGPPMPGASDRAPHQERPVAFAFMDDGTSPGPRMRPAAAAGRARLPSAVEHGVPLRPNTAGHTPRPAPQKDAHDLRRSPDGLLQGLCPARRPRGGGLLLYPGLWAIWARRITHRLYRLGVPLPPSPASARC